jgi:membrane protein DedA with SNARE-associated domain
MKPLGQMNRNLVGSIYGMSSMKIAHFVPIVNKHGYHRNLVRIVYGMSSMKIAHFVPIG